MIVSYLIIVFMQKSVFYFFIVLKLFADFILEID